MKSIVAKAAWYAMILFIIPTQTSNSINKANKPRKHNETLGKHRQMSRDRTSVENNRVCNNMNEQALPGPSNETLFMTPDDETLASREIAIVKTDIVSTVNCIGFASAKTDDPRKRHCAEISDEPRKNACLDQFGSFEHDQTKVPSQNSSNADKPPKVTHGNREQSIVDKHGDTSRSTSCNEPVTDSQQMGDDDAKADNPSTKASTLPPVADVNPYEKEPLVELKKTSDQACNNFESQTLSQTPANFSKDESSTEHSSVESQDNESCNDTCIANVHTEEQFTREISKFIVNLTNNDRVVIKVGEGYNIGEYKLEVIHLLNHSYVFKTNFNGRDLVIKYLTSLRRSYEKEIVVQVKHKNIVEVYDSFYTEDEKGFFIVMEAMDCDLSEFSYKHPDKIKDAVKSVVNALQYLHSLGIAHCDIKLGNILTKTFEGETVYKLCDFGCALYIDDDEMTEPDKYICTEAYQAPEMFFDGAFSKKTDIWLLGHTIWYYIERGNKFSNECGQFNTDKYKKYLKSPEECPLRKNRLEIINKCCTEDPKKRASFKTILQWCNERE